MVLSIYHATKTTGGIIDTSQQLATVQRRTLTTHWRITQYLFTERQFQIKCKVHQQHIGQKCHKIYSIACQRFEQKEHIISNEQRPGRPRKCRSFFAGLRDSQYLDKNVVYCLSWIFCGDTTLEKSNDEWLFFSKYLRWLWAKHFGANITAGSTETS